MTRLSAKPFIGAPKTMNIPSNLGCVGLANTLDHRSKSKTRP